MIGRPVISRDWPATVERAVALLLLDEDALRTLASTEKARLIEVHCGLGTYIRNQFGLWADNRALVEDCSRQAGSVQLLSPDDAPALFP